MFFTLTSSSIQPPANHAKSENSIDNLYKPIYVGDSNVTEGQQFWISCTADPPISWYIDGKPIEKHFERHEFTFSADDNEGDVHNGKIKSRLNFGRAALRHKGKYQCNVNHENSHYVHVQPTEAPPEEIDDRLMPDELENDHEDVRDSFEPELEDDQQMPSTMMMYTLPVVETSRTEPDNEQFDDDDEKSHENLKVDQPTMSEEQPTTLDDFKPFELATTSQLFSTTTSSSTPASFTNISSHPTHATHNNHAVHSTHAIPSEVQTQTHPDKHHKGSQTKKNEK